ncbi:MAG: hypothetical protein CML31_05290 [Rhizobiales bacterium]|nr:hypothetical protein [Hoeflea sp.]MBG19367.1 hypothetical protein [Hyphomicrobiales bacterium]|tara:strand:+ start:2679 stop:2873 length:195 start_codon:yes stop_codon:yes gene_type:complete
MTKPVYERGIRISSPIVAMHLISQGVTLWYRDKPLSASYLLGWSVRTVMIKCNRGLIFHARRIS